ncbi:hypothetical protein ACFL2Q_12500, partial [Thermodesulfobacteriota bacterium]
TLAELTSFIGITEEKGRALINGSLRYLANPPEEEDNGLEGLMKRHMSEHEGLEEDAEDEDDEEPEGELAASDDDDEDAEEELSASDEDDEDTDDELSADETDEDESAEQDSPVAESDVPLEVEDANESRPSA